MIEACGKPDTVYHYCDLSGFQGILTSKELWLHDAYFSNDYSEHRLILEKAVTQLRDLARDPRNTAFCDKLEASLLSESIHPYVCCFSSEPDLLSQWRAYRSTFSEAYPTLRRKAVCRKYGQESVGRMLSRIKISGTNSAYSNGWDLGKHVEVIPHYRRPHMMLAWTGRGRAVPKVVPKRGSVVHREVVEKVPMGWEG